MTRLRICVIGNSHLAALKLAWNAIATEHPGCEMTFFGSPGRHMNTLERAGRVLLSRDKATAKRMATTSGGRARIKVDDYDVFVIHGLHQFNEYCSAAFRAGLLSGNAATGSAASPLLPDVLHGLPGEYVRGLLAPFGKPVLCSPSPRVSEAVLAHPHRWADMYRACIGDDGAPTAAALALLKSWDAFLDRPGTVRQPDESLVHGLFTREKFAHRSGRHDANTAGAEATGGPDVYHANAGYGRLLLPRLLDACRAAAATPVAAAAETASPARRHPYAALPARCFWNRAVSGRDGEAIGEWYTRKFPLDDAAIATAGSCFAQHIGKRLRHSGFRFLDTEPAPASLDPAQHAAHGYGLYSARYGNVYTTRQLLQLFERAFGEFTPAERHWQKDGGFVDPFRPTIRPEPFATRDELDTATESHLAAVRALFESTDVFVFTLGLTETWASAQDGAVYPVAPGVSGGEYDPSRHHFINLGPFEVMKDLKAFMDKARAIRGDMRFLLTVSPVPLMATATGEHVVSATSWSKSVLRAVAGQLAMQRRYVDYFPSFEIINSHVMGGRFYGEDKRSVVEAGVDHVMQQFFREHRPPMATTAEAQDGADDDVVCDEALLAAFGKPTARAP